MAKEKKNKEKKVKETNLNDNVVVENENDTEAPTKKQNKVVASFNLYKFILKLVAAVLLLVFGIIILVEQTWAIFALLFTTGAVAGIAAIVRLALCLKNGKSPQAKRITAIESLIILVLGAYLVGISFVYKKSPDNAVAAFTAGNYGLFLAVILYVKALGYFWEQVLYKEATTKFMFWLHIAFMTCAVLFAALRKTDAKYIVITLAVVALLCALLIGGEAATGYYRYRRFLHPKKEKKVEKEIEDKDANEIEAPAKDESKIIDEIDPNTIPTNDNDKDSSIVS